MAQEKIDNTDRVSIWARWRDFLPIAIALLVITLDQWSKRLVVLKLPLGVPWNPIESLSRYVSFTYITNKGAAFGLFPSLGTFFAVIAIVVVVVILLYYRHLPNKHWPMYVGLGLQLGGALGNLIDRIRLGHVVDFIDFKVWPVFNVADSSVVIGVTILALSILRDDEEAPQQQEQQVSRISQDSSD